MNNNNKWIKRIFYSFLITSIISTFGLIVLSAMDIVSKLFAFVIVSSGWAILGFIIGILITKVVKEIRQLEISFLSKTKNLDSDSFKKIREKDEFIYRFELLNWFNEFKNNQKPILISSLDEEELVISLSYTYLNTYRKIDSIFLIDIKEFSYQLEKKNFARKMLEDLGLFDDEYFKLYLLSQLIVSKNKSFLEEMFIWLKLILRILADAFFTKNTNNHLINKKAVLLTSLRDSIDKYNRGVIFSNVDFCSNTIEPMFYNFATQFNEFTFTSTSYHTQFDNTLINRFWNSEEVISFSIQPLDIYSASIKSCVEENTYDIKLSWDHINNITTIKRKLESEDFQNRYCVTSEKNSFKKHFQNNNIGQIADKYFIAPINRLPNNQRNFILTLLNIPTGISYQEFNEIAKYFDISSVELNNLRTFLVASEVMYESYSHTYISSEDILNTEDKLLKKEEYLFTVCAIPNNAGIKRILPLTFDYPLPYFLTTYLIQQSGYIYFNEACRKVLFQSFSKTIMLSYDFITDFFLERKDKDIIEKEKIKACCTLNYWGISDLRNKQHEIQKSLKKSDSKTPINDKQPVSLFQHDYMNTPLMDNSLYEYYNLLQSPLADTGFKYESK